MLAQAGRHGEGVCVCVTLCFFWCVVVRPVFALTSCECLVELKKDEDTLHTPHHWIGTC